MNIEIHKTMKQYDFFGFDVMAQDECGRQLFKNEGNTTETHPCGKEEKWNEVSNIMESNRKEQLLSLAESSGNRTIYCSSIE